MNGESVKTIAPKTINSPNTPMVIIFFFPNLDPSHPHGRANKRNANEKNTSENDAASSVIPMYLVPYNVNKASTP
ncbi:hypothetical protein D1872_304020 [compost metagenome]